jgi:hypothetical protein
MLYVLEANFWVRSSQKKMFWFGKKKTLIYPIFPDLVRPSELSNLSIIRLSLKGMSCPGEFELATNPCSGFCKSIWAESSSNVFFI